MKVLWITNIPFGPLCEVEGQGKAVSGGWLDAAYNAIANELNIELTVVTVSRVKGTIKKKDGKNTFYILPGGFPNEYNKSSAKNRKNWEWINAECQPDVIQIWGTEYPHGFVALQVMENVPAIIYMQGVIRQIARHYLSGMSKTELLKSITFRDIIRFDWIKRQQSKYLKRSVNEADMINLAGNVIVENEWCEAQCMAIAPHCVCFKSNLSIKREFYNHEWEPGFIEPYTILCSAAGYPIKGLHILLKALSLVIQKFPQTKLLIPGTKMHLNLSFNDKLRINGYTKHIMKSINNLQLNNNVQFLGKLSTNEFADKMAHANVFVMPSSIENHSSTLIEAMTVGVPCISTFVGGVPEYLKHNSNGLLYRFEEFEMLAYNIIKIFENKEFAHNVALSGRNSMRNSRNPNNIKNDFLDIYNKLVGLK